MFWCGWGAAGTDGPLVPYWYPTGFWGGLGAAEVVYDERDVDAVHLQQVFQEGVVPLGVQPHGPHVISSDGGVRAPRHLRERLEDPVVQLHEEPGRKV